MTTALIYFSFLWRESACAENTLCGLLFLFLFDLFHALHAYIDCRDIRVGMIFTFPNYKLTQLQPDKKIWWLQMGRWVHTLCKNVHLTVHNPSYSRFDVIVSLGHFVYLLRPMKCCILLLNQYATDGRVTASCYSTTLKLYSYCFCCSCCYSAITITVTALTTTVTSTALTTTASILCHDDYCYCYCHNYYCFYANRTITTATHIAATASTKCL